jgi:uncharacterized protein YbbC (DUF1343 family)
MRRGTFVGSVAAAAAALAATPLFAGTASPVLLGGDVLLRDHARELAGASIGIITNQTGVTASGTSIVQAVRAAGLHVRALYSPEHGLDGNHPAGTFVDSYVDERTGLPVYSLYGPDRHPTPKMLEGIDVLLFDIQDVGARPYTFVSTMAFAMQSAAAHGIAFWVLDRPNPVGGVLVEGPVLEPKYASFVGLYPIPLRHGMTVGELAQLFNRHFGIGATLRVVAMDGWRREMIWPQTGLSWIRTSPNIPTWQTTFVYLCTGMADSEGINNGVGTPTPFFYAGAPNLDAALFASRLSQFALAGIAFEPATWVPTTGYNAGRAFSGARLALTDPAAFLPVTACVDILATARDIRPSLLDLEDMREIDIDWGQDAIRSQLRDGASAREIVDSWQPGLTQFAPLRERFLLYT